MPDVSCKNTQTAYKGDANFGLIFHFLTPRQHLKKVHGITGAAVEVSSLTVPASMAYADGIMEPLRVSYALYPFPPELKLLTKGSQGAAEIVSHTNEAILGRFYCQEYDCGRGFSSKVHLESHMRVFHLEQASA